MDTASIPTLHLVNLHEGLGDVLTCLWSIQSAKNQGFNVRFYTPKHEAARLWHEDSHPTAMADDDATIIYGRLNEARKLWTAGISRMRLGIIHDRIPGAQWYEPARPQLRPEVQALAVPPIWTNHWGRDLDWSKVVLLFPFSEWAHREWPIGHWRMLEDLLEADGFQPVTMGLAANRTELANFRRSVWGLPLLQLIGAMQAAALTIGNDSGPAHLSEALNTPLIRIHAMYPPWAFTRPTSSAYPSAKGCQGCCAQPEAGYRPPTCAKVCPQLATISPHEIRHRATPHLKAI